MLYFIIGSIIVLYVILLIIKNSKQELVIFVNMVLVILVWDWYESNAYFIFGQINNAYEQKLIIMFIITILSGITLFLANRWDKKTISKEKKCITIVFTIIILIVNIGTAFFRIF